MVIGICETHQKSGDKGRYFWILYDTPNLKTIETDIETAEQINKQKCNRLYKSKPVEVQFALLTGL